MLTEQVSGLTKRMDGMEDMKEILIEFKTLTAEQIKANEKRDIILGEQSIMLVKASESLKTIGDKTDATTKKVDGLEKKISSNEKSNSITIPEIVKYLLFMAIGAVMTAIMAGVIK